MQNFKGTICGAAGRYELTSRVEQKIYKLRIFRLMPSLKGGSSPRAQTDLFGAKRLSVGASIPWTCIVSKPPALPQRGTVL
jgi:hypothetical protein